MDEVWGYKLSYKKTNIIEEQYQQYYMFSDNPYLAEFPFVSIIRKDFITVLSHMNKFNVVLYTRGNPTYAKYVYDGLNLFIITFLIIKVMRLHNQYIHLILIV